MKIGLFLGSFNPIHTGHLIIASQILNEGLVERIWFVVSPQNPFKARNSLLEEDARLDLVKKAIDGDKRLKASNIEFKLPRPSYTIDTLTSLKSKYTKDEFIVIMGSDSFKELDKWKSSDEIITNYNILVYPRPGFAVTTELPAGVQILQTLQVEISSTKIRDLIKQRKSVRYLVPEAVRKEIKRCGYYRK